MFIFKAYTMTGGLMSYGADNIAMYGQSASFVAEILHGAKPADLPVELPTRFEFAVNLRTAKAIGVELPTSILLRQRGDRVNSLAVFAPLRISARVYLARRLTHETAQIHHACCRRGGRMAARRPRTATGNSRDRLFQRAVGGRPAWVPGGISRRFGCGGVHHGRNVAIEYRYADNQPSRLNALAADLIGRRVAVIVATGGNNSGLVAKSLTSTIPIVFTSGLIG